MKSALVVAFAVVLVLSGCSTYSTNDSPASRSISSVHELGKAACEDYGGVWADTESGCLTTAEIGIWMTSVCDCEDYATCRSRGFPQYVQGGPGCDLLTGVWGDGETIADSENAVSQSDGQPDVPKLPDGAISWTDARAYVGSSVTICGDVVSSRAAYDSNGQPTFINVGASYPSTSGFTVVIWGESLGNFVTDPASAYSGRTVCVDGELYSYKEHVQIEAWSPAQIEVMD